MKKTLIKYFGVTSTTLLAVAPVAAPAIQSALNVTTTEKVFATDNTGTRIPMDLSAQDDYSKLFQRSIISADAPFTSIEGAIVSDPEELGPDVDNPYNINLIQGLIQLAQLTNGVDTEVPEDTFTDGLESNVKVHYTDVAKYLFTNTDGSARRNLTDFYYDSTKSLKSLKLVAPNHDSNTRQDRVYPIYDAARFISDKIGGRNVSDILGTSTFGNPNKGTLKVLINGTDGKGLKPKDLASQGRIVISLVAQSGTLDNGTKRTATAFLSLQNSTVLLEHADGKNVEYTYETNPHPWGTELINSLANTSMIADIAKISDDGYVHNESDGSGWGEYTWPQTIDLSSNSSGLAAYEYFADSGNYKPLDVNSSDSAAAEAATKATEAISTEGHLSAYATDTVVVPEGTTLQEVINKLKNNAYNGAPSVKNYGTTLVADKGFLAYDDVNVKGNSTDDWRGRLTNGGLSVSTSATGSDAVSLNKVGEGVSDSSILVRPGGYSVEVPVTGNVYVPGQSGDKFSFANGKVFLKNFERKTKVNVVVYPNPGMWNKDYTLGTLPSFALFPALTANAAVPTFYDNGQTVKEADIPSALQSKTLNITVGDPRFYDASSKTTSKNKLNSFLDGAFATAIANKQLLISDEDVKSSRQPIDPNNLIADYDFPDGANHYTRRPDANTNNASDGSSYSVDASAVDLSKAGTYDVKFTYTNSKNKKIGLGTEASTITIPVTISSTDEPAFYFVGGSEQTIKVGGSFNPMNFKVAQSMDEINEMVANGSINDGKDYVNDPAKTGLDVTVSGSVDTTTPGSYHLVYTATNIASGKTTTLNRTITVIADSSSDNRTPDVVEFNAVGYVDYIPGYGINVWDAPEGKFTGQRLPDMSSWKIDHKTTINGKTWYQVGKNQWIDGSYVSLNPVTHMKPLEGSVKIDYVPGYSVRVYQSADDTRPTEQMLKHGTEWKVFGKLNGYYNVGKDQWIKVQYGKRV